MNDYDYSIYYRLFHNESEAHAKECANYIESVISPFLPDKHDVQILDIGCGFGFALRAMRKLGFTNCTGLEMSHQQADVCREAGFNVAETQDTSDWLKNHPSTFGVVLLLDVLEHLPVTEQINLLRAINTALLPGGRIILTVPNANAILASRWRYNDFTHYSSFTEHSLFFVLRNAGFDKIQIESEKGLAHIGIKPSDPKSWRNLLNMINFRYLRRWFVRWCWLQVYKAELPGENLENISFELNLKAVAIKND